MKKKNTKKIEKNSFVQLLRTLKDEKSCREFLEEMRWQGEPVCPHCGSQSEGEQWRHYKYLLIPVKLSAGNYTKFSTDNIVVNEN